MPSHAFQSSPRGILSAIPWRIGLVLLWLLFTLSLTGWWFAFGIRQNFRLIELENGTHSELIRYQRMLFWEGSTLVLTILIGGGAIAYWMWREMRERRRIQEFLGAFSHELRTPLTSLRLQAELLAERLSGTATVPELQRFMRETERLSLQLENSLFLVELPKGRLLVEQVSLSDLASDLRYRVPELSLRVVGEGMILGDERALRCILANLAQNALVHGQARELCLEIAAHRAGIRLTVSDDGRGFTGDLALLKEPFARVAATSGSGLGLHIVRSLTRLMGGQMHFVPAKSGFTVTIDLPGRV